MTLIKADWEKIKKSIDSEFYIFVNNYLKLEIRELQKYIFDLIECLLKVSNQDEKSIFFIREMFSTGVLVNSVITEISKIENDQKFEKKILGILSDLLLFNKFFEIFRKNGGIDFVIEYHDGCFDQELKLVVARIMLEGLKNGIFRPYKIFSGFICSIVSEIS